MPDTIIYAENSDGYINKSSTLNYVTARDATVGSGISSSATRNAVGIQAHKYAARGGGSEWRVSRSFFMFDTSSFAAYADVTSVILSLRGYSNSSGDVIVARGTQGVLLSTADFDAIHGWSGGGGDESGNVTFYSNQMSTWNTSAYNDIPLNSTAISFINAGNNLEICVLNYDYDLLGVDPGSNTDTRNGLYYTDYTGTSYDPYITVTIPSADNAIFFGTNF